jgi:hypothetical protein
MICTEHGIKACINIMSNVELNGSSDYFQCSVGVRQGENFNLPKQTLEPSCAYARKNKPGPGQTMPHL